jgi:predicted MFS family arabinose efflux permease
MGTWVAHINVIARQAGVGTATLGHLLLTLGGSAFAGMRLCGPLSDRLGPRLVIPVSAALFSAAVVLPALARKVWSLAGALAALGFTAAYAAGVLRPAPQPAERPARQPVSAD